VDPDSDPTAKSPGTVASENGVVSMETEGFEGLDLTANGYSDYVKLFYKNRQYLESQEKAVRHSLHNRVATGELTAAGLGVKDIWDGDGKNPNAWLTIFRHGKSASTHRGPVAGFPKTVWVMNFANTERLYYNLVAHFKYWSSMGHRVSTWRTMSHIRLHAEDTFLGFVPQEDRLAIRQYWAGGLEIPGELVPKLLGAKRYIDFFPLANMGRPSRIKRLPGHSALESTLIQFAEHMRPIYGETFFDSINGNTDNGFPFVENQRRELIDIPQITSPEVFENVFAKINRQKGYRTYAGMFPSNTIIRLRLNDRDTCEKVGSCQLLTVLSHRGYKSHNAFFLEEANRDPSRDTVTLHRGAIGPFPNLYLDLDAAKARAFLKALQGFITTSPDNPKDKLKAVLSNAKVSRFQSEFWSFTDWMHRELVNMQDGHKFGGILDISLYEY